MPAVAKRQQMSMSSTLQVYRAHNSSATMVVNKNRPCRLELPVFFRPGPSARARSARLITMRGVSANIAGDLGRPRQGLTSVGGSSLANASR